MIDKAVPFSRPFQVADLDEAPTLVSIEADEAERSALASELGLPAIGALAADLQICKRPYDIVLVEGELRAALTQVCVVTLDPFESSLVEPIRVEFAPAGAQPTPAAPPRRRPAIQPAPIEPDPPDPIVDGRIDLGALVAEFLALALDPYPRKPGVSFDEPARPRTAEDSPFAPLGQLKPNKD